MHILLTYDISSKKGKRLAHLCENELVRVQKSVFEGEISYKRLARLKDGIRRAIDITQDSVLIYYLDEDGALSKESIGKLMRTDYRFL